jgi:hypothetical protein
MSFNPDPSQFEKLKRILLREKIRIAPKVDPELEAIKNADLLTWTEHFLPHYCTKPFSKMHRWLAGELDKISSVSRRK